MKIEITAAQVRLMTGRCAYHGSPLWLAAHGDGELPESPLDAWTCSAYAHDPDVTQSHREYTELIRLMQKIPDYRERMDANLAGLRELEARCRDSWVLTVPGAVPGC